MSFSPTGVKFKHHPQWRSSLLQIIMKGGEALLSVVFIISLAGPMVFPDQANAAPGVSKYLSYQGRLTDTSGNPLGAGGTTYYFCLSIYNASSGGTKLWPSGTPTATSTSVANGVFNVDIGSSGADVLDTYDFASNDAQYLNIEASATTGTCGGAPFETLAPRQRLAAVAYARVAADVYGTALRTSSTATGIGAGTGQGTPIWLNLDWKNTETALGGGCPSGSVNGSVWYNSNQTRALACVNNAVVLINNASDFSGIKESAAGSVVNAGSIILSNAGGISISQSTATLATNKTDQTIGTFGFSNLNAGGISTMGNTLGTNGTGTGTIFFAGGNNITLSQATAAGARTITISAPNQSAQPVAISGSNGSFAFSTVSFGNLNGLSFYTSNGSIVGSYTAGAGGGIAGIAGSGASTVTNGTLQFANANGVSFGLNGSTMTASVVAGGGGIGGITAGTFSTNPSSLYFSNANGVSFGLNSGANSSVITASVGAGGAGATISRYIWPPAQLTAVSSVPQGSVSIQFFPLYQNLSASRMDVIMSISLGSSAVANTAGAAITQRMGIFSKNGSTLMSLTTASNQQTISWASNTGSVSSITGMRLMSIPVNINATPGEYYIGYEMSTAATSIGTATTALAPILSIYGGALGTVGVIATNWGLTATSQNVFGGMGVYSAQVATNFGNLSLSGIYQSGTAVSRANFWVQLRNI